ncbi:hypothetical protein ACP4OV_022619 [Aristida adscensionis]
MDRNPPPPPTADHPEIRDMLEAYIYDYLMGRNFITTAGVFAEETQGRPLRYTNGVFGGLLSDWWDIFSDIFSSRIKFLSQPEGHPLEEKPFDVAEHFGEQEGQVQQRAILNRSTNAIFDMYRTQQDHGVKLWGQEPMDLAAHVQMQQPCQQSTGDQASDYHMLDLSRDDALQKSLGIGIADGFTLKAGSKKILCCDFSSGGDLLASSGDDNKVFVWDVNNNLEQRTWEAHPDFVTDIIFRPKDTLLATASTDKTVRLWDASQVGHCVQTFVGHSYRVKSIDFHPRNTSVLCSSDDGGKIFFWTIGQRNPRISKVTARGKIKFHPGGSCFASAVGSTVNLIDLETDKMITCFQGNKDKKNIQSICWNERVDCLAATSEDCVRIWSWTGQNLRELNGSMSYYGSCIFHPTYPNTLVIGGFQTITLWNFAENKTTVVQPHGCYVADLAGCVAKGWFASASHDGSVKVWS